MRKSVPMRAYTVSAVQAFMEGQHGSEVDELPDDIPKATPSVKAKGKKRAQPVEENDSNVSTLSKGSADSGWGSWEKKVIVS